MLLDRQDKVRAVDIANFLKFSKSSVSIALEQLKENDYIYTQHNGNIILTDKGKKNCFGNVRTTYNAH